jgi:transcriptional regulator with XRE-family HTH domain
MTDPSSLQKWVFQVVSYPQESLGHYLGRFRRANCLSRNGLGELLGIEGKIVRDWEILSRRRRPTPAQLAALSQLVGVPPEELTQMLPPEPTQVHISTRLCGACYSEVPIHQRAWQQSGIEQCEFHQLPLVASCPDCGSGFRVPALWTTGCCERCWLPFNQMSLDLGQ